MSKPQRLWMALTVVNFVLLAFLLAQALRPAWAQPDLPVLRGRGLEIVDGQGRVRASLQLTPAGRLPSGEAYPEGVLLRLITERGRPAVKIGASEQAAGLSFAGPTGTRETYVILEAKETRSRLLLRDESGQQLLVTP